MPLSTMTLYYTPWSIQRNVQSLHYLCCSHDCSSGCNIQPFSPKMHQCVIAFVLRLANIVVNFLKQLRKKHINIVSLIIIVKLVLCAVLTPGVSYISWW